MTILNAISVSPKSHLTFGGSSNSATTKIAFTGADEVASSAAKGAKTSPIRRFFTKVMIGLPILGAGYLTSCGPNEGPVGPVDPPYEKPNIKDEVFQMMKNTYAVTDAEIQAGKIKNDSLAIKESDGTISGIKYLGTKGDSVIMRSSNYTVEPNGKTYLNSVGIDKYYKAIDDGKGTISVKNYYSPNFIFNDSKMKFAAIKKLFTKDGATQLIIDGKKQVEFTVKTAGKEIFEKNLGRPYEDPAILLRLY